MTDRVEAAERLLHTLAIGRAHVRALALQHLPPGRALSMELNATGLRHETRAVAAPAPAVTPPTAEATPRAPEEPHAPTRTTIHPSVSLDAIAPPDSEPDTMAVFIESPTTATVAVQVRASEAPQAFEAGEEPDAAGALEAAEDPEAVEAPGIPARQEGDFEASTQLISMDDGLRAAVQIASEGQTPIGDAFHDMTSAPTPRFLDTDEDTSDDDTDPGPLTEEPSLQPSQGSPDPAPPAGEGDGLSLLDDRLNPTAGWAYDVDDVDDDSVGASAVGGMSWGDTPDTDSPSLFLDDDLSAPAAVTTLPTPPASDEEDEERTQTAMANSPVLGAIKAADAAAMSDTEEGEDFELSADELNWGDTPGAAISAPVAGTNDTPPSSTEELDWGHNSGADWTMPDLPDSVPEPTTDTPPSEDAIRWDDEDGAPPSPDPAPAENHASVDGPTISLLSPASSVPTGDTEEFTEADAPEEQTRIDMPSLPRIPAEPSPILAIPRVVEPRAIDALEEAAGAAAIQILGVGQAQTLTPTLELGGAPEEPELAETPSLGGHPGERDGFSLQFEEPEDEVDGPHIPELTESVAVAHTPVDLSSDGMVLPQPTAPQTSLLGESEAQSFLNQARAAEQKGSLRDAVVHYDDLLSHDPHNLVGHLGRGRCLVDLGDYGSAMSDFTRAEDIAPDSPEPLVEMGNLFFARKEYKRAITYYDHALELDNKHAMAFSRRGISYYHRKMFAEAHNDLIEAERRDPSIPGLQRYIQVAARKTKKRR